MNAKDLGNQPAYPFSGMDYRAGQTFMTVHSGGMTKREAFAMAAMQGVLANTRFMDGAVTLAEERGVPEARIYARAAVGAADALLAELAKDQP